MQLPIHNRVQQVGVLGELSSPTVVISGVPQGSVLGPLLFQIYIDGLSEIQLSGGSIVFFADDLLLHHLITCLEDFQHVQNDIDELVNGSVLEHVSSYRYLGVLISSIMTSLGLTILRMSAQKHISRLDYYTIVFISMLHQQP